MGSSNAGEDAGEGYNPAGKPVQALEECYLYLVTPPLMPSVCSWFCFLVWCIFFLIYAYAPDPVCITCAALLAHLWAPHPGVFCQVSMLCWLSSVRAGTIRACCIDRLPCRRLSAVIAHRRCLPAKCTGPRVLL